MMIGDGVLSAVCPRQRVSLWRRGPEPWRHLAGFFDERPRLTAALGAASVLAGLWLAGLWLAFQAQNDGV